MNKEDLISSIALKTGKTKIETRKIFDSIFETIAEILSNEKSLTITGFGHFSTIEKERRKGFNPSIEKFMMLPPKINPKFKSSDLLKEKIQ